MPKKTSLGMGSEPQSILEVGLHSRQSLLVRLTNQFDAFFSPKTASETKAPNNEEMFKLNTNNSTG